MPEMRQQQLDTAAICQDLVVEVCVETQMPTAASRLRNFKTETSEKNKKESRAVAVSCWPTPELEAPYRKRKHCSYVGTQVDISGVQWPSVAASR